MAIGVIVGMTAVARAKAARTSSNTQCVRKSRVSAKDSNRDPVTGKALGLAGAAAVIEGSLVVMTLIPRLGAIGQMDTAAPASRPSGISIDVHRARPRRG